MKRSDRIRLYFDKDALAEFRYKKRAAEEHKISPEAALEVCHLNCVFKDKRVLSSLSCSFKKGVVYGIVGPSGSGKSTFCEHLNGLQRSETANIYYSSGEKILFFQSKLKNYKSIRKEVGMVFQFPEYQLFKETVLQDIVVGPKILFNISQSKIGPWEEKAKRILSELSFPLELIDSSPFKLSGGQKRKVTLAGILILEPKVIVFDEPTLGLDPQSVAQVVEVVKQLNEKGITIIIASSSMDFILECSQQILYLESGHLKRCEEAYSFFRGCPDTLVKPKVISFVEKLVEENPSFDCLWQLQPRNVNQLAESIVNAVKYP
ncbi:cobalt transporter ATP-binding subunit [Candidatus Mycoplasma haematolamae str. Purdue]|uniref:Cobalt transporter ATP-binding subunit n=1 Tax=Mycoplasma haematolamae (strain Purdue) TaxID=1212765 RepID=I7CIS4_MYCHA|nr:ATP-binding cassette domain-containing protein [Candidatus Mycoplasma haematolamae]AFO51774.1 cobalt transporter ATP-binding subunit [Candidatus Mycoplasma haematolamae str. Purdue]